MNDINNLGSFSSIDAVWAKYPEGGKEGDFLTIGGVNPFLLQNCLTLSGVLQKLCISHIIKI